MKFVKVTALAAAMMTTFGAQAELTAMDDSALEAVTGQKGINIVLTNHATHGNILTTDAAYDDLDGSAGTSTAGSLYMTGTEISGTAGTGSNELQVSVDVHHTATEDQLVIGLTGLSIANTAMSIGATNLTLAAVAAGTSTAASLMRTSMTFNGTMAISIDAQ